MTRNQAATSAASATAKPDDTIGQMSESEIRNLLDAIIASPDGVCMIPNRQLRWLLTIALQVVNGHDGA